MSWFDIATGLNEKVIEVLDGEDAKSMEAVTQLCVEFSRLGLSRRDVVVAIGGGATTDLVGFASAVYLRGIAVIHVPTTLAAQVDASIGGKTGVNLPTGKNLVGAFHQPVGVLCDDETLVTLPEREILGGLGEVAKCWLLRGGDVAGLSGKTQSDLVAMAVELKAEIVGNDELESGQRALLNYGHTLAHALEAENLAGRFLDIRHGEAVAIGLAFAARLARDLGRIGNDQVQIHDEILDYFHLTRRLPKGLDIDNLLGAMGRDKKAHHDLTFVLAGENGFSSVAGILPSTVLKSLQSFEGES
jgi:5-deoxy-5-amino-3-dehydroquinate synthase